MQRHIHFIEIFPTLASLFIYTTLNRLSEDKTVREVVTCRCAILL
jgi:hypothetical protein